MKMVRGIISSVVEGVIKRITAAGRSFETFTNRETFQHYGFTSRPLNGAEGIFIVQGNQIIAIAEDDRRYRIAIENGELAFYTDENLQGWGHRIHFKRNREIEIACDLKDVNVETDKTLDIGQDYLTNIGRNKTTVIVNDKAETVGNNKTEAITLNKTETIGGNKSETILGNKTATVTNNITLSASGDVSITGTNINIHATGVASIDLDGDATINQAGALTINSSGGNTQINNTGGLVKINSGNVELGSGTLKNLVLDGAVTSVEGGSGAHSHTVTANATNVKGS